MIAIIAYITIREGVMMGWREFIRSLPALIIAPLGWLGYLLWRNTLVDVGLFETYNQFSGISVVDPITAFYRASMKLITTWDLNILIDIITLIFFGSILLGMIRQVKFRKEVDLTLYSILTFASFLPWTSDLVSPYQSVTRYVVSLFPLFIVIAYYLIKVRKIERNWYVVANLCLMIVCVSLYTLWIFVG